jgi:Flp pilus assembly protein TadD
MGLFYLLTLYCFIRGAEADGPGRNGWHAASIAACFLGMATKEVMVSAPLIVLLYDRAFLAGGFVEAWRRRWRVYVGLAATWLVPAFLMLSAKGRGASAGFGTSVAWWRYALTQPPAIVHYLRLSFWPHPLIFDYGSALAPQSLGTLTCALVIVGLIAATAWALVNRPALGFLGASFFAILAPSSSIVPVATETMAEHRMYLPLIPVVVLVVIGTYRWLGRGALPFCLALAAVLAGATWQRNEVFRSEEGIWRDTVDKRPDNERAHNNLGFALRKIPGRLNEAIAQYEEALRLKPDYVEAHYDLGNALISAGRAPEAIAQYGEALRLQPDIFAAHSNLGNALMSVGRTPEAITQYEEALRLRPDDARIHFNLALALLRTPGRTNEAVTHLEEVVRLQPGNARARQILARIIGSQQ